MRTISITIISDDEEEVEHQLPAKNEVCDRCDGYGHHTNPAIDGNGITGSEMAEILYNDPDFLDDYMSGTFDITCEVCRGSNVVLVVDEDACTEEQKQLFQQWAEQESERYALDAEDRHTMFMENGGRW